MYGYNYLVKFKYETKMKNRFRKFIFGLVGYPGFGIERDNRENIKSYIIEIYESNREVYNIPNKFEGIRIDIRYIKEGEKRML